MEKLIAANPCRKSSAVSPSIQVCGLTHTFGQGETRVPVLKNLTLEIDPGEVIILMGPSGSGKTTLLTLLGCLRSVQAGSVKILGRELRQATPANLIQLRQQMGFIFQAHNLHNSLTAIENVRMGLQIHGPEAVKNWKQNCRKTLELVGLGDRVNFLPEKLSGGQKQRVAVARAIVGNPAIIFADEPTAALDKQSGQMVIELLRRLADHRGTTVLIVTHDHRILEYADRIIQMEEGRVVSGETSSD